MRTEYIYYSTNILFNLAVQCTWFQWLKRVVSYWSLKLAHGPSLELVFTRFFRRLSFKGWMALHCKGLKYLEKGCMFHCQAKINV